MILISFVFILLFTLNYKRNTKIDLSQNNIELNIVDVETKEEYVKYKCKYKIEYVIVYDYTNSNYIPGDVVNFYGTIKEISNTSDFDYKTYEKSLYTYAKVSSKKSEFVKHKNNIYYYKYKIKEFYKDKLDTNLNVYFSSLIFGSQISDEDLKDNINKLGISYLFVISGFHISLLALLLDKLLSLFIKKEKIRNISIISFLFIYTFICSFAVGVFRAFLSYTLKKINKDKTLSLTNLDIYSLSFLILIFINPLNIFKASFKFSYVATLFIVLGQSLINFKNKIMHDYALTLLCFLSTLPISVNMNYQINFITLILGPLFVFLFSFIIMPLLYVLLFIPSLGPIIGEIYLLFTNLINYFSNFDFLIINVSELKSFEIVIYYILFFFLLVSLETKKKIMKSILSFLVYFLIIINLKYIYPFTSVTMINVGQGDSFLIRDKEYTMCIDSFNTNINYIKSQGISKIDVLVITHSDTDHIGSALELINTFNVKSVIFNKYEDSDISKEISKKVLDVKYLSGGDVFYFGTNLCNVLGPIENIDTNNNSLVFDITLNDVSFLFNGDIEQKAEEEIFTKDYTYDFVKIAHHGSKTSTSDLFIENVKFDNALISVATDNIYNHPSSETIDKLGEKTLYLTSKSNTVVIYLKNSKYFVYETIRKKYLLKLLDMI